jgi:hypothetical protein
VSERFGWSRAASAISPLQPQLVAGLLPAF